MKNSADVLYDYAMSHLGIPYKWGGRNRLDGLDCSQFCIELLISAGILKHGYDTTAQGLYNYFMRNGQENICEFGSLAFFGTNPGSIIHIGFCLTPDLMIEAGGGNHTVTNPKAAIDRAAFIKIRPIKYRSDLYDTIKPLYKFK